VRDPPVARADPSAPATFPLRESERRRPSGRRRSVV